MPDKVLIKKLIIIGIGFLVVVGILRIFIPPQVDVLEKQSEIPAIVVPITYPSTH